MTDATEPQSKAVQPSAVAMHYKASSSYWEQRALVLQDELLQAITERNALHDELERLKNPPTVVKQPQSQA